jgi:phosphoribosylglycinamide formyltransferase-1
VGVLCSGTGTNLEALIAAERAGTLGPATIRVVIVNKPEAGARRRAEAAAIPCVVLEHGEYPRREAYDAALVKALRAADVQIVALAGFMRVVTPTLLDAFPGHVLNIHPSLLPAYPGIHAQRQAIENGAKVTGATVHFVDSGLDSGPIVLQAAVPVQESDDESSLSARILVEEHRIFPEAVRLLAEDRLRIEGRRVHLLPPRGGDAA